MNEVFLRATAFSLFVVLIATLSGCGDEESCAVEGDTFCMEGRVYIVDTCGNFLENTEICKCGCNPDHTACAGCCTGTCPTLGDSQCADGRIRTCERGAEGCLDWSSFSACPDGFCADATSCGTCNDRCGPVHSTQCADGQFRTCEADQNGCLSWSNYSNCQDGSCADSISCGSCNNQCSPASSTQCTNGEIRTCEADQNGCLDWSNYTNCQEGFCADPLSCGDCNNQCSPSGLTQCSNGEIRTCEADQNGCLDWSSYTNCRDGFCADSESCGTCNNQCAPIGSTLCTNGEMRTCEADQNGCLDWDGGYACPEGFCADTTSCGQCTNLCPAEGVVECSAGVLWTCVADGRGCLDWVEDSTCPDGFCADTSTCGECNHQCGQLNESQCVDGEIRHCSEDSNGCRVWSDFVACPAPAASCLDEHTCTICAHECPYLQATECRPDPVSNCADELNGCSDLVRTCIMGQSGCWEWSEYSLCPQGYYCGGGDACVPEPYPPRLTSPLSTSLVATRVPTFTWELGDNSDAAQIRLCANPNCNTVLQTLSGSVDVIPAPLDSGPVFWYGVGLRRQLDGSDLVGRPRSAVWVAYLRNGDAYVDTFWGHVPDWDRDGKAEIVTTATHRDYERRVLAFDSVYDTDPRMTNGADLDIVSAIGDVNGDGFGDFAMISRAPGAWDDFLYPYYGGSSLSSSARQNFAENFDVSGVVGGFDVNADGYGDIIVKGGQLGLDRPEVHLLYGSISGLSVIDSTLILEVSCNRITTADFNGDRYPDLVCAKNGVVKVFGSYGTEAFSLAATLVNPTPTGGLFGSAVLVGELNGDGYGDLLVVQGNCRFHIYLGGSMGLAEQASQTVDLAGQTNAVAGLGDINGDGLDDFVWGKGIWPDDSIEVHLGAVDGFDAVSDQSIPVTGLYHRKFNLIGDLDGDGNADLALSGDTIDMSTTLLIYEGNSNGLDTYYDTMTVNSYYLLRGGLGAVLPGSQ